MVASVKESIKQKASESEIYDKMQAAFIEIETTPVVSSLFITLIRHRVLWLLPGIEVNLFPVSCNRTLKLFLFFEWHFFFRRLPQCTRSLKT